MGSFSTADLALARRLEAAEAANGLAMAAGSPAAEAEPLLGGCALFAGAGSPMTHALGIGMDPAGDAAFDQLERFFHSRGSASHRNYERAGFGLAYMRVNLRREL